jgi:hypothetical protein
VHVHLCMQTFENSTKQNTRAARFRGRHFNSAGRIHGPTRTVDSLTVTELWSLKNEAGNRSLHAKLIGSLYERRPVLQVQAR